MPKTLLTLAINEQLTPSDWMLIDQKRINLFAQATGDQQWIHVDEARCAKESPFKSTIAHGFLTVTLMSEAFYNMIKLDPATQTVLNYGVERIRFLEPVRVNDQIRFVSTLLKTEHKPSGQLFYFSTEGQIKNREKPAFIGVFLMLLVA
ncbi:MAG: acyl dehydratase [Paraglaciecola sp.]|jgi:acyl dehydratase